MDRALNKIDNITISMNFRMLIIVQKEQKSINSIHDTNNAITNILYGNHTSTTIEYTEAMKLLTIIIRDNSTHSIMKKNNTCSNLTH